jgi:hypothetical protein
MCGDSARTIRSFSAAGRSGSSVRSAAVIFSAYVTPSDGWGTNGGCSSSARASSVPASSSSRDASVPYVSSSRIPIACDRHTGPVSSPASRRMMPTPVSRSPAMIARSIGAAPRHRGSSDGCTFSGAKPSSSRSPISAPNAQTTTASGAAAAIRSYAASSLIDSGWSTSIASSRATATIGGGASTCPRPRLRSGRVTTRLGVWPAAARRRSTPAANSDVPT